MQLSEDRDHKAEKIFEEMALSLPNEDLAHLPSPVGAGTGHVPMTGSRLRSVDARLAA